ncbi:hypothetical protein FPV67DRAFT_1650552 [Lyophyllum atratum]|nr:hypothetical protein FPV67DRAFT_1650552 [Lyophyllum atratum]
MPIVEIERFLGSDAFVADPLVLKDALDILLDVDGVISVHYGIQTEDGRTGYLIVIWETYERCMDFEQQPSYVELQSCLSLARSSFLDSQHIDFDEDAAPSLEAPTTEIATLNPQPGVSLHNFHIRAMLLREGLVHEETCHSVAWGESKEKKGSWILAIGWDSMQDHLDAVSTSMFPELIGSLEERAAIYVEHTNLVKYAVN